MKLPQTGRRPEWPPCSSSPTSPAGRGRASVSPSVMASRTGAEATGLMTGQQGDNRPEDELPEMWGVHECRATACSASSNPANSPLTMALWSRLRSGDATPSSRPRECTRRGRRVSMLLSVHRRGARRFAGGLCAVTANDRLPNPADAGSFAFGCGVSRVHEISRLAAWLTVCVVLTIILPPSTACRQGSQDVRAGSTVDIAGARLHQRSIGPRGTGRTSGAFPAPRMNDATSSGGPEFRLQIAAFIAELRAPCR